MGQVRFRRLGAAVALVALGATTVVGCSDDPFERAEFVEQVTGKDGGLDRAIANCVFDQMADDPVLLDDIGEHGGWSDQITAASDAKMQKIVARCILADGSTTTTTEPR